MTPILFQTRPSAYTSLIPDFLSPRCSPPHCLPSTPKNAGSLRGPRGTRGCRGSRPPPARPWKLPRPLPPQPSAPRSPRGSQMLADGRTESAEPSLQKRKVELKKNSSTFRGRREERAAAWPAPCPPLSGKTSPVWEAPREGPEGASEHTALSGRPGAPGGAERLCARGERPRVARLGAAAPPEGRARVRAPGPSQPGAASLCTVSPNVPAGRARTTQSRSPRWQSRRPTEIPALESRTPQCVARGVGARARVPGTACG